MTIIAANFVDDVLVDVVRHRLVGAHGRQRGAVVVIAGSVETVCLLLDGAEVLL